MRWRARRAQCNLEGMSTIETLTEDERACMYGTTLRRKALRLIDVQAARIVELLGYFEDWRERCAKTEIERDTAEARAAALSAEVELWKRRYWEGAGAYVGLDCRLAAANALLEKIRVEVNDRSLSAVSAPVTEDQATMAGRYHVCVFLLRNVLAHLAAGQPATAPALTGEVKGVGTVRLDGPKWPCGCPVVGRAGGTHSCPKPTRTEAEQAVLKTREHDAQYDCEYQVAQVCEAYAKLRQQRELAESYVALETQALAAAPIRGGANETHDDPPVPGGYTGVPAMPGTFGQYDETGLFLGTEDQV